MILILEKETIGETMQFLFPSKFLDKPENQDQKDSLRKVATEIKMSVPDTMRNSAHYSLTNVRVGTKTLVNKLRAKPKKIVQGSGPGHATYTVDSWDKNKIELIVTVAGKLDFWIF